MDDFDPIDLAMLGVGFARGLGPKADTVNMERAGYLYCAATWLTTLYREVADEWDGPCWAYEVAEPLGYWLGDYYLLNDEIPARAATEERARQLIDDALEDEAAK